MTEKQEVKIMIEMATLGFRANKLALDLVKLNFKDQKVKPQEVTGAFCTYILHMIRTISEMADEKVIEIATEYVKKGGEI